MSDKVGVPFEVHVDRGDSTGKCWHGTFRAKATVSFSDQFRLARIKRDLLGPGPYDGMDEDTLAWAMILSELQVRLTESPEWWGDGMNHSDNNLLLEIFKGVKKVAEDHMKEIQASGAEARERLQSK